jgi:carboxyl-terminal processing protease
MFPNRKIYSILIIVVISISAFWLFNNVAIGNNDTYYKIDKGLFYLKEVFETISRNYVDELDPEGLSKSAINGMLEEFDPYTVFYEDPGSQNLQMITRGKYGGIGMEIGIHDGEITVMSPMDDTPAKRAGVQAGDIISKINGIPTEELSLEEASQKLRGKIGTEVTLEFKRPMVDKPIVISFTREEIVISDVTFAEIIEPGTAFIRLSRFSDKASKELKDAIRDLQSEQKLERVILDLRQNPGGLLTAAVEVANVFLNSGELVVSTKGSHESETKFYTEEQPLLPNENLIILIDQFSASASEIVAGAIQDLDRGVIVGESSFGKGLVQKVYPIDKISQAYLKVTTAKYYTPSGRSIQKEEYKRNRAVFTNLSDSIEYDNKIDFRTKNNRIVHGGGGVKPDIEVLENLPNRYLMMLSGRGYLFQFTVDYLSKHAEIKKDGPIHVEDEILAEFMDYILQQNINYEMQGRRELDEFLEIAEKNDYDQDLKDLITVAVQKLNSKKSKILQDNKEIIREMLEAEFAEKLGGTKARIRNILNYDLQTKKALEVFHDANKYSQILAVQEMPEKK